MNNKKLIITTILALLFAGSIAILFTEGSLLITDYIAPSLLAIFSGSGLLIWWHKEN